MTHVSKPSETPEPSKPVRETGEMKEYTPVEYLLSDLGCKYDKTFEKKSWEERINKGRETVRKYLPYIEELYGLEDYKDRIEYIIGSDSYSDSCDSIGSIGSDNPEELFKDFHNSLMEADNPVKLKAALQAVADTVKGEPTGYTISLDASSSGIQLLGILSSCKRSLMLTGGGEPGDLYSIIYKRFKEKANLPEKTTIDRKKIKKAIMTAFYGSVKVPRELLGDKYMEVFHEVLEEELPGPYNLNEYIQALYRRVKEPEFHWVMPDGFKVLYSLADTESVKTEFLESKIEVQFNVPGVPKYHKALSANSIHAVDSFIAREMLRRLYYDVNTIEGIKGELLIPSETLNQEEAETVLKNRKLIIKRTGSDNMQEFKELISLYENTRVFTLRIFDYLDSINLAVLKVLYPDIYSRVKEYIDGCNYEPVEMLITHDCFSCHPADGNHVRREYNRLLKEIHESNLLNHIIKGIVPKGKKVSIRREIKEDMILNANYTLT